MNVIPGEASAGLDGRLLPGFSPEDLMEEIGAVAGRPDEFEVVRFYPGPPEPDMSLFGLLAETLREADPGADAVPFFLAGALAQPIKARRSPSRIGKRVFLLSMQAASCILKLCSVRNRVGGAVGCFLPPSNAVGPRKASAGRSIFPGAALQAE